MRREHLRVASFARRCRLGAGGTRVGALSNECGYECRKRGVVCLRTQRELHRALRPLVIAPRPPRFICIPCVAPRLFARTWEGPPATYTVPTTHVPPRTPAESGSFCSRMHQPEIAPFHRPFPKKHLPPPVKIENHHGFFQNPRRPHEDLRRGPETEILVVLATMDIAHKWYPPKRGNRNHGGHGEHGGAAS